MRATEWRSGYSDMSRRTSARSSSNRVSASARASSVLPTPVGPRNRNVPTGRVGSLSPARARRTAAATARDRVVLADDPAVQLAARAAPASRPRPRAAWCTGMPVHLATIAAISSSPTSSFSIAPSRCSSREPPRLVLELALRARGSSRSAAPPRASSAPSRAARSASSRERSSCSWIWAMRVMTAFSFSQRWRSPCRRSAEIGQLVLDLGAVAPRTPRPIRGPERLALDLELQRLRCAPRRSRPGPSRSAGAAAPPPRPRGRSPCRAGSGR